MFSGFASSRGRNAFIDESFILTTLLLCGSKAHAGPTKVEGNRASNLGWKPSDYFAPLHFHIAFSSSVFSLHMAGHSGTHHGHETNRASMDWFCRRHLLDVNKYLSDPRYIRHAPPGARRHVDYDTHYRFRRHIVMNTWRKVIQEFPGDSVDSIVDKVASRLWTELPIHPPDADIDWDELEAANVLAAPASDTFLSTMRNNGLKPERNMYSHKYLPPGVRAARAVKKKFAGRTEVSVEDAALQDREFLLKEYTDGPILSIGHAERAARALFRSDLPERYRDYYENPHFRLDSAWYKRLLADNPLPGHFTTFGDLLDFITICGVLYGPEDKLEGVAHEFEPPKMLQKGEFHVEAEYAGHYDNQSMHEARAYCDFVTTGRSMWKRRVRQFVKDMLLLRQNRRGLHGQLDRADRHFDFAVEHPNGVPFQDLGLPSRHITEGRTETVAVYCADMDFTHHFPGHCYSVLHTYQDDNHRVIPSFFMTQDVLPAIHRERRNMVRFLPPDPTHNVVIGERQVLPAHIREAVPTHKPGMTADMWMNNGGILQYNPSNRHPEQLAWSLAHYPYDGTPGARRLSLPCRSWILEIEGPVAWHIKRQIDERNVYAARTWFEERIRQMGSIEAALAPDANGDLPLPPTRDIEFHQQSMILPEQAELYAYTPTDSGHYHHERPRHGRPVIRIHHLSKWLHKLMPWTRMMYTSKPKVWQLAEYKLWVIRRNAHDAVIQFRNRIMKRRPSRDAEIELFRQSRLHDATWFPFWRHIMHNDRKVREFVRGVIQSLDPFAPNPDVLRVPDREPMDTEPPRHHNCRVDQGNLVHGPELIPLHRRPPLTTHNLHFRALNRRLQRRDAYAWDVPIEERPLREWRLVSGFHTPELTRNLFQVNRWWVHDTPHACHIRQEARSDAANSVPIPVAPEKLEFCDAVALLRDHPLDELRLLSIIYQVVLPPFIFFDKYRWDSWYPNQSEFCSFCGFRCVPTHKGSIRLHNAAHIYPGRQEESYPIVCPCSLFNPRQEPGATFAREVYCSRACFMRSSHRPANIWDPVTWTSSQRRHMKFEVPSSIPYFFGMPESVCQIINSHVVHKKNAGLYADEGVRVFCETDPPRPAIIPRAAGDDRGISFPGDDRPVLDEFGIPENTGTADMPQYSEPPNKLPDQMWQWSSRPHAPWRTLGRLGIV